MTNVLQEHLQYYVPQDAPQSCLLIKLPKAIYAKCAEIVLDSLEKEQVFFTEKPSGKPSYVYGARDIKGLRREPSTVSI